MNSNFCKVKREVRAVPSGGGGGEWEATARLEIRQSDYNALISVVSAHPEIRETISALPPCSKHSRYDPGGSLLM